VSADIAEAKERLPLPGLLHRLGLSNCARKKAHCPFPNHPDKNPSFSVFRGNSGEWRFHCFGCNSGGDEIEFLRQYDNLSNGAAIRRYFDLADVNGSKPFGTAFKETKAVMSKDWQPEPKPVTLAKPVPVSQTFDWEKCVNAFGPGHLELLSEWRGFSGEFCSWLHKKKLVGLYNGHVAFSVRNGHKVVGAHVCPLNSKDWFYQPKGTSASPLIFGEIAPGDIVHCFESTWDGLAFLDKSGERSGVIITRGASNAKFVIESAGKASVLYLWSQNDAAGEKWQQDICANTKATVKRMKIPAHDLNDWTRAGATDKHLLGAIVNAETLREPERPLIEFRSPLELKNFVPPPGLVLVGDFHIVKGNVFVEGGAPGVGKSRAAAALAVAGATASDWFGLRVHRRFKTMIVQTENGEFRLAREFAELDCETLEDYVRVCPPPPFGLCFGREDFRKQLAVAIREFQPDVIIFDPWNAAARDERAREYLETFDALRSVLPAGDDAPALGIVAHTRKPKTDERASGRALLNLLAGSYVLGSVPRTVFVMQAASDATTDNRVVWTCCKNNDGELGHRSAWERRNGLFAPVSEFDWDAFDAADKDAREVICENDLAKIFQNGPLTKSEAVRLLESNTGAHRASCYRALEPKGRFGKRLRFEGERINWK
jgi:CHC2-type zinc finger protein/AAA domain-containing protein